MRIFGNERCTKVALTAAMGVMLLVGLSASAWALPVVDENFSYAVGSALVGQGGWAQTGTTTTNPILVTTPGSELRGLPQIRHRRGGDPDGHRPGRQQDAHRDHLGQAPTRPCWSR